MINFIDTIVATSAGAVILAVICMMPQTRVGKLAAAAVFGAWAGVAIAVAASGGLVRPAAVGVLFAVPLVVVGMFAVRSAKVRSAMLSIPISIVIGVNVFRVLGAAFLVLASLGRLGGPFPYSAGWGDVLVGALAIPVAILATRVPANDLRIVAWNVLGTLDLVLAVTLGIGSANGSPLQFIHDAAGSDAMASLPYSIVPTFLVPLFLIGHGIVLAHVRAASAARGSRSVLGSPAAV
jgi:hypothetical protein